LREPFLDHRLVELAIRQPADRKLRDDSTKWLLRRLLHRRLLPADTVNTPKRPVQTPQREWLRGPLKDWASACIAAAVAGRPDWLDAAEVGAAWDAYGRGESDNSVYVWQWISLALVIGEARDRRGRERPPADFVFASGETCELA
jgi:asparagine synthase (glutamine-hydrolysing)